MITLAEVTGIAGSAGDFQVALRQKPRYVDTDKCIACGVCAAKCPRKVPDEYEQGLGQRKAIYLPYSQAVPLKYVIDPEQCIFIQKGKCRACEKFCPSGAINFDDKERELSLRVGAIVLAPGFRTVEPPDKAAYLYGAHPDVVTSLEFERLLSATGPFGGHLVRPSLKDPKKPPRKIAWLQCVGSRDVCHDDRAYCSAVCCMYALKQAVIAKEHSSEPLDCTIFYMDMRTQGKDFDRYLEKAKAEGIRLVPMRVHSLEPESGGDRVLACYLGPDGKPREEAFDLVVLSVGMEVPPQVAELAERLDVDLDRYQFVDSPGPNPVETSRPGIYACGAFTGPKDIPQAVMEASAAANAAAAGLAEARGSQVTVEEAPPERQVARQKPRIGVFVCHCGINIAGVIRVDEVAEYARTLPGVVYVEENLFTCSQDTQEKMARVIREKQLNRVVVAACSPKTHESLFQETLRNAGLNKYLLEMANIRNHDSWVHAAWPDAATQKAKDLVRMAVAKSSLLDPLQELEIGVKQAGLVVGGGVAGLTAALSLADHGYETHLVECQSELGGQARHLFRSFKTPDMPAMLEELVAKARNHPRVKLHLESEIERVDGFVGNFTTILRTPEGPETVEHGVTILASGAREHKPQQYLYGEHPAVVTHLELDRLFLEQDPRLQELKRVAFIQCVGSREPERPYCSKVCCTHTMESALELKRINPQMEVYVFYRDIRTYGLRELLYQQARRQGVIFIRYTPEERPVVTSRQDGVQVQFREPILDRRLALPVDLLCLATAIEATEQRELAQHFKVPLDGDGWFLEAHQKLRPVEFAADGVFLCGLAHYPKPVEESIAQAQAAASKALVVLSQDRIKLSGVVSSIDPRRCTGCGACVQACPYQAIQMDSEQQVAVVNPALCKGCGACAAACPSQVPILAGFTHREIYAQINSALAGI